MHTDSEWESDTSSINEGMVVGPLTPAGSVAAVAKPVIGREQLENRIESLVQENRVLKIEIETYKMRIKAQQEENKELRRASVNMHVRAEQEEEYMTNKLFKKIQSLKKEKETLANNYEREEEFLTNDLSRQLTRLKNEKVQLEQTLEQEQEQMVNKLMKKIQKLEAETSAKQASLEQLRREKIELENTLEQEQESLVNRLWKRLERLETEKRMLKGKIDQPAGDASSASDSAPSLNSSSSGIGSALSSSPSQAMACSPAPSVGLEPSANLNDHIINLRKEIARLKTNLEKTEREHKKTMTKMAREEKAIRDENLRLQRRLQLELDRREALCRHLSESESSLEMDDERHFNEFNRVRTLSSPSTGLQMVKPPVGLGAITSGLPMPPTFLPINPKSTSTATPDPKLSARKSLGPPMPIDSPVCPTCNQKLKS